MSAVTARHSPARAWPADAAVTARRGWDPLLLAVATYVLTAVARVHQLFDALELIHVAVITGLLAIGLYIFDAHEERQTRLVLGPTTRLIGALIFWMILSVPNALVVGNSFDLVFNNFLKTALMSLIVAGEHPRDATTSNGWRSSTSSAPCSIPPSSSRRFDLGAGDAWRLGHLYYYDANDFATFVVTALPLGIYFLHAGRSVSDPVVRRRPVSAS